ncbi:MAG: phosphoribosylformylglycinamidine cyclo-ligase [Clostridia bacterium]|nr:MAG: phosphoribosylformylglycinamidine cyclo-ligase [Clostridia bacterium]
MAENGWTYAASGVDIAAGDQAARLYGELARRTWRPEVIGPWGSFGGFFALDTGKYRRPVLVAGADGVGTKLRVAITLEQHQTVGLDLVAMCVNDILVHGAEPLFFLDYLATGRLDPERAAAVVAGVAAGCRQAGCALLGGETAEMPGFYTPGDYDLAGFAVGVVEKEDLIDGHLVTPGDVLLGLASSGLHSNGFSLARRVLLEDGGYSLEQYVAGLGCTLGEELLRPTRIYVSSILSLLRRDPEDPASPGRQIHGMAHITGGGLPGNLSRILPPGAQARVERGSWPLPPVFALIQEAGRVATYEMYRVFNMGLGMVLVVARQAAEAAATALEEHGEKVYRVGEIVAGQGGVILA